VTVYGNQPGTVALYWLVADAAWCAVLQSLGLNFALAVDLGQLPKPNRNSGDDRDALESRQPLVYSINVHLGLAFLFSFESAPSEKLHVLVYHPHEV
jgi:hypothetical protein